jgi:hypothetical protein
VDPEEIKSQKQKEQWAFSCALFPQVFDKSHFFNESTAGIPRLQFVALKRKQSMSF